MQPRPDTATGTDTGAGPPVTVELFGLPRILAGRKDLTAPGQTLGELAGALVSACPALAGSVVDAERHELRGGYIFVVNDRFTRDPAYQIPPGASVLLVSSVAGG